MLLQLTGVECTGQARQFIFGVIEQEEHLGQIALVAVVSGNPSAPGHRLTYHF